MTETEQIIGIITAMILVWFATMIIAKRLGKEDVERYKASNESSAAGARDGN